MRTVHKIALIAIGYGAILVVFTLIFFRTYVAWAALGAATALFNHSQMINATKGQPNTKRIMFHIGQRYLLYGIMFAVAFFDTRDLEPDVMTTTFIFLLLGFIAIKVATIIYALPFFKHENEEAIMEEKHD